MKFNGIITHQTVSDNDFKKILTISVNKIPDVSNVGVQIVKDQNSVYKKMSNSIYNIITNNNKNGKETKLILPVGPTPQYELLLNIFHEKRTDLSNVWLFFMDEYLDWESRMIEENHPMSFKGYMKRGFFNRLDKSLGLKNQNIIWPNPNDLNFNMKKIEELGGIDVCYGGLGYHGHIAFNEPYDIYYSRMSINKFLNSATRIVNLNSDTFVVNSICGLGGNCYGLPPKAVTIGMKAIIESKRIEIYCDGGDLNWQLASFRIACMHPPTLDRPSTLLQLHEKPKENVLLIADRITASPIEPSPK